MSDLIERQTVIDVLYDWREHSMTDAEAWHLKQVIFDIKCMPSLVLPSAEPELKKGKWEVQPSTGDDRPFIWWKCSECGHVIFSETERDRKEFHAFCGRCGADMTRGDDEQA